MCFTNLHTGYLLVILAVIFCAIKCTLLIKKNKKKKQIFDLPMSSQSSVMESWNSSLLESKTGKRPLVSFIWY